MRSNRESVPVRSPSAGRAFAVIAACASITVLLCTSPPAAAQEIEHERDRSIRVQGEATVRRAPDRASVRFGVVTEAEVPEEARSANAEAAERALEAVRSLGVPDGSIRLERLQLRPNYRFTPDGGREQTGYEVERMVAVQLDSLDLLPTLVARVVQEGANRLEQVQYDLAHREEARNTALRHAVEDARERARHMAEAAGERIGSVLRLTEQQVAVPQPMFRVEAMDAAGSSGPRPEAYAAGEIEIEARVEAVFALE